MRGGTGSGPGRGRNGVCTLQVTVVMPVVAAPVPPAMCWALSPEWGPPRLRQPQDRVTIGTLKPGRATCHLGGLWEGWVLIGGSGPALCRPKGQLCTDQGPNTLGSSGEQQGSLSTP